MLATTAVRFGVNRIGGQRDVVKFDRAKIWVKKHEMTAVCY